MVAPQRKRLVAALSYFNILASALIPGKPTPHHINRYYTSV